MKESIVRITTADTKKTYEFPHKANPQLWEVKLSMVSVTFNGSSYAHMSAEKIIYLERETLENAGLLPNNKYESVTSKEPEETAEDLIIRLLEHVGYYPCQHE